jgi:carboxylate-amine ligase
VCALPDWALWAPGAADRPWSLGVEEEVMLLDPAGWGLAQAIDDVLPVLDPQLQPHVTAETHAGALELASGVHDVPAAAAAELEGLRAALVAALVPLGLRAGVSGTHPTAQWHETRVSGGARYQLLHGHLRALAQREPTFALHVHVGVGDPELAVRVAGRMRAHLPLLLALSANSPFWQGRDSGLASARTSLFQAFPRAGIPRRFGSYEEWVETVSVLVDSEAIPEPTFLWWDVRLQPRLGTVEIRIMDAQTNLEDVAALVALTQALVALEAQEDFAGETLLDSGEVLQENRFLAARDGMEARLIDPAHRRRVPARALLGEVLEAVAPHALRLGSSDDLAAVERLAADPPAARQRRIGRGARGLPGLVECLSDAFVAPLASEVRS